jgi:hypothetical protein
VSVSPEEKDEDTDLNDFELETIQQTSSDLLSSATDILKHQSGEISSFLDKLKGGEITTPSASNFRARRLTYASKTVDHVEPPSPMVGTRRTTLYTSAERGVRQLKVAPFPNDILGTYSCHGIEPSTSSDPDEADVHDKINQDRGCVVYPFNNSTEDTLFLVLDGHGNQGDRVSEFVMRQV